MKVVLAEKPSVARDLAAVLGATRRRDGYLEGGGYQVTWAFGHLVTLQEPDEYDERLKRWSLETLPILPEEFVLKLTGDAGARKQYRVIEGLFREGEELICATDAGREGELIFRYILEMSGCVGKPFRRLWLSSLTDVAIKRAFAELAPGTKYDDLYAAARCRSEADWIVGMNATRNFTVRYGQRGVLWSVGRVQTPVLALIVLRCDEIMHFVAEPWFEVRTRYRDVVFKSRGERFKAKAAAEAKTAAEALVAAIEGSDFTVTGVKKKKEQDRPPQLYDLTALQRDMNARYGMSAANVLKDAQGLYESKFVTYPRTDSRYLTADMHAEVKDVLRRLGESGDESRRAAVAALDVDGLPQDRRIFDDAKVSDHHAILPTGRPPGQLSPTAQKIYDAVALRAIAAFYPPCKKEVTTVDGKVEGKVDGKVEGKVDGGVHAFRARGVCVTDPGWTVLYPKAKTKTDARANANSKSRVEGADEDRQDLPAFAVKESGPHAPEIKEGETRPPRYYDESSLLAAMETAGRLVEDEELKEALKARGLGTPATRAAIIETLLRRRYIRRERKALHATDLGRYLIAVIQNPILKSPEMTGEWEARLHDIEAGRLDAASFMGEIAAFTRDVIAGSDQGRLDHDSLGVCPKCGGEIVAGRRGYGCSKWREGCAFVLWKEYMGKAVSEQQARELLQRRISMRPIRIDEQPFVLVLTDKGQLSHVAVPQREHQRGPAGASKSSKRYAKETPATKGRGDGKPLRPAKSKASSRAKATAQATACPLCGQAMVERETSYSCSARRDGCTFAIDKTIAGKKISKATARLLLTKGTTRLLKGFVSRSQKPFSARLKLIDGRVRFELGEGSGA